MPDWDQRYQTAEHAGDACEVLLRYQHLLPSEGKSLDLASGLGANALLLAKRGLESHAWDSSAVALQKLQQFASQQALSVQTLQRDVEAQPPEVQSFDVIVVSHFLHRPSFPQLLDALKPGGLLYYQTFIADKPDGIGPSNPAFVLQPNELLRHASSLGVLAYHEEGQVGDTTQGFRHQAMLVAHKVAKS